MAGNINFSGLSSGLDTGAIIQQLVMLERQPILHLEEQKDEFDSQKSKLQDISSKVQSFETAAQAISKTSKLNFYTGSSSDTDVLDVSVSGSARAASYSIDVSQLATHDRSYSGSFSGAVGVNQDDTFTLDIDGTLTSLTLDADDTLEDIASRVNSSDAAAWATVVSDGQGGGQLLIVSDETGEDQQITFGGTAAASIGMTTSQAAQNASVVIDNEVTVSSADNNLEDIINGISLNLKDTGTSTVKVELDNNTLKEKIDTFVEKYNEVITKINSEFSWTGEARTEGNLSGDSTLRNVQRTLQNGIIETVPGLSGEYTALSMIGITTNQNGTLSVDTTELDEALADDPNAVKDLFAYNADNDTRGVAHRLAERETSGELSVLEAIIDTNVGTLSLRLDGIDERVDEIDRAIEQKEARLEAYEQRLRMDFLAMEQTMSQLQNQSGFLAGLGNG